MIISCHQPNFFPWKPYFDKIAQADIFIVLNNVQYTRHQFQNRFNYLGNWMTMPVEVGHLSDLIKNKKYVNPDMAWGKIKNKMKTPKLSEFDSLFSESLAMTNRGIIDLICAKLQIKTPILEDMPTKESNASKRLIDLCVAHGATTYLAGPSGRNYLDSELFTSNGIRIKYFESDNTSSILEFL